MGTVSRGTVPDSWGPSLRCHEWFPTPHAFTGSVVLVQLLLVQSVLRLTFLFLFSIENTRTLGGRI